MNEAGYYIKIAVDFRMREDGGLRASSPDVEGLLLSGANPSAVLEDVAPAIEHLMKQNHGLDFEMRPLTSARDFLENRGVIKPEANRDHTMEFAGRLKVA